LHKIRRNAPRYHPTNPLATPNIIRNKTQQFGHHHHQITKLSHSINANNLVDASDIASTLRNFSAPPTTGLDGVSGMPLLQVGTACKPSSSTLSENMQRHPTPACKAAHACKHVQQLQVSTCVASHTLQLLAQPTHDSELIRVKSWIIVQLQAPKSHLILKA
jgi:hypothetical protein